MSNSSPSTEPWTSEARRPGRASPLKGGAASGRGPRSTAGGEKRPAQGLWPRSAVPSRKLGGAGSDLWGWALPRIRSDDPLAGPRGAEGSPHAALLQPCSAGRRRRFRCGPQGQTCDLDGSEGSDRVAAARRIRPIERNRSRPARGLPPRKIFRGGRPRPRRPPGARPATQAMAFEQGQVRKRESGRGAWAEAAGGSRAGRGAASDPPAPQAGERTETAIRAAFVSRRR